MGVFPLFWGVMYFLIQIGGLRIDGIMLFCKATVTLQRYKFVFAGGALANKPWGSSFSGLALVNLGAVLTCVVFAL
jgi:hypothetical protein